MWLYEGEEFSEDIKKYEGFVYLIENLTNGRKYVGKKSFWQRRKNRKTGRRQKKESDWKKYFGSSDEVKADVKELGEENFKRTILRLCIYAKEMSFHEQREQWERGVLHTDEYYNTNIGGKFFVTESEKIYGVEYTVTTKNDAWREEASARMTGDGNIAKRPDVRAKLSEASSGENNAMFGKTGADHPRYGTKHGPEFSEKTSGENHHSYSGKWVTPWGVFTSVDRASKDPAAWLKGYAIRSACSNPEKSVNKRHLQYGYRKEDLGKRFIDLGFYREFD
jgi:hypothetical protein